MRLRQGDIIESSEAGFAQLEFAEGAIVALGPSSRLFLFKIATNHTAGKAGANTAELVLLSGWLKGQTGSSAGEYRYASPLLSAATRDGTVVLHATAAEVEMFVESGEANVCEVDADGGCRHPSIAKNGEFFSRTVGKRMASSKRPSPAFIESVPRPFHDTFPSRLSRFTGKSVEPQRDHEVTYSEIESWLSIALPWRRGFVGRFQPRLRDAGFRKAIEAHLADHPEWGAAVHPEKIRPKTSAAAADSSDLQQKR
jgi:hypothetical protein